MNQPTKILVGFNIYFNFHQFDFTCFYLISMCFEISFIFVSFVPDDEFDYFDHVITPYLLIEPMTFSLIYFSIHYFLILHPEFNYFNIRMYLWDLEHLYCFYFLFKNLHFISIHYCLFINLLQFLVLHEGFVYLF